MRVTKHIRWATFVLPFLLLFSCGETEEVDYEALDEAERVKERVVLDSVATGNAVNAYKGLKLIVRALPVSMDMDSLDMNQVSTLPKEHRLLDGSTVNKLVMKLMPDLAQKTGTKYTISAYEYYSMAGDMMTLSSDVEKMNEDDFPTMLNVMTTLYHLVDPSGVTSHDVEWNETKEHLVLASLLEHTEYLPNTLGLYELNKINTSSLSDDGFKPFAHLMKGTMLMEEGYFYLADEQFREATRMMESGGQNLESSFTSSVFGGSADAKTQNDHLLAMSYLLRSAARYRCGAEHKKSESKEDAKLFVDMMESAHIDNELSWSAAAAYYLQDEDMDRAKEYLSKLQNSNMLGDEEKTALAAIVGYVDARDANSALNGLFDNIFIISLAEAYLHSYQESSVWYRQIIGTTAGAMLFNMPNLLDQEYARVISWEEQGGKIIDDMVDAVNVDSLQDQGTKLLDDLGSEVDSLFSW